MRSQISYRKVTVRVPTVDFSSLIRMRGHGSQRIVINWNTGSVLVLLAKTDDCDVKDNSESISPE